MNIKVGDLVRIKTYDEMLKGEVLVNIRGDIYLDESGMNSVYHYYMAHLGNMFVRVDPKNYREASKIVTVIPSLDNSQGFAITESMVSLVEMK